MNSSGQIFDIKRCEMHDGPGIRTTVFLKGCPLRCPWCHNPEGVHSHAEVMIDFQRCTGCGSCVKACKPEALRLLNKELSFDRQCCDFCLACVDACTYECISRVGKVVSVDEIVKECMKDRDYYNFSGGGVTFSGGEPLMQPLFLKAVASGLKQEGTSVAVETAGYADRSVLETLIAVVDLWIYDVKLLDEEKHKRFTGKDNKIIIENLRYLLGKANIWLRIPVVPGVNDTDEDADEFVSFVKQHGHDFERLEILGFHALAETKYKRMGLHYPFSHKEVSREFLERLRSKMAAVFQGEIRLLTV